MEQISLKNYQIWFHQIYIDAEQSKNDFHPVILPWDVHPDRDEEWFDNETKNMSRRQIAQELECNFNMSGETVIDGEDIIRIKNEKKNNYSFKSKIRNAIRNKS